MKNLKVGQKVFDYVAQEWITISNVLHTGTYPIFTEEAGTYTTEGKWHKDDVIPRLSLTAFNPITGTGTFTPIDQEPPIQVGDRVFAWDEEGGDIMYGELQFINTHDIFPYRLYRGGEWKFVSKERPHWLP